MIEILFAFEVALRLIVSIGIWTSLALVVSFIGTVLAERVACASLYQTDDSFRYAKLIMYLPIGLLASGALALLTILKAHCSAGSIGAGALCQLLLLGSFLFLIGYIETLVGFPFALFAFLDQGRSDSLRTFVQQDRLAQRSWTQIRDLTIVRATRQRFTIAWKYAFSRTVSEITCAIFLFLTVIFQLPMVRILLAGGPISWVLPNFYNVLILLNYQTYAQHQSLIGSFVGYLLCVPLICLTTAMFGFLVVQLISNLDTYPIFSRLVDRIRAMISIPGDLIYLAYQRSIDTALLLGFGWMVGSYGIEPILRAWNFTAIWSQLFALMKLFVLSFVVVNLGICVSILLLATGDQGVVLRLRGISNLILSTPSPTWSIFLSFFVFVPLLLFADTGQLLFWMTLVNFWWVLLIAAMIGSAIGHLNLQNLFAEPLVHERIQLYEQLGVSRRQIYRDLLRQSILDVMRKSNLVMIGRFLETVLGINFLLNFLLPEFLRSIAQAGVFGGTGPMVHLIDQYCFTALTQWMIVAVILVLIILIGWVIGVIDREQRIYKSMSRGFDRMMTYILYRMV